MNSYKHIVLIIMIWLAGMTQAFALSPTYQDFLGRAIKGYDPVAYFTQGQAQKGQRSISYQWKGAKWYFVSQQNRTLFQNNPEQYAPQYGGYCAWAVSNGYTAKIDPQAWTIFQGKLYLNYSPSVQKKWLKDMKHNITKADKQWPVLMNR